LDEVDDHSLPERIALNTLIRWQNSYIVLRSPIREHFGDDVAWESIEDR
jgi:hypothetical protein